MSDHQAMTAPQSQLAAALAAQHEAEAKLAMACAACGPLRDAACECRCAAFIGAHATECVALTEALKATAPTVAAFTARLKRQGAAEAGALLEDCVPWLCSAYGSMKANEHHPQAMVNLLTTMQAVMRFQGKPDAAERFQKELDTVKRAAELEAKR